MQENQTRARLLNCGLRPYKLLFYVVVFVGFTGSFAHAGRPDQALACSPLQVSIGPASLVSQYRSICGLSLNLPTGGNEVVTGLDAGFIGGALRVNGIQTNLIGNVTAFSDSSDINSGIRGIQVGGLLNILFGADLVGLQLAGLFNIGDFDGIQAAGFFNSSGKATGIQVAAVNAAETLTGLQVGVAGNQAQVLYGAQIGLINKVERLEGFQIGLVNMAKTAHGMQVGLVNIIKRGVIPFLPLINAQF